MKLTSFLAGAGVFVWAYAAWKLIVWPMIGYFRIKKHYRKLAAQDRCRRKIPCDVDTEYEFVRLEHHHVDEEGNTVKGYFRKK